MAKLITETSFKALIQAIGKKLGQIDTQVATDKSKLANLESNFDTKAVEAINNELGINILTVKGEAEDANRLLGDLKTAMFGSKEPYKVAKDSELEILKGKVNTFFEGATFDSDGNNVIDTLKEIVDYLKTNPSGTTAVADINVFKTILKKLSGIENLFDEHGVPNTEKVNEVMSAKEKIDISLRNYAQKSDLDHYLRKIDLQELRLEDAVYTINKHLFDDKRVVTASGDDVNINLNATDLQLAQEDRL